MNHLYLVRFVGAAPGVSDAELYSALLRLLKNDAAKVDELLDAPGTILRKVPTSEEAESLIAQLRKFGIECRMDEDTPPAAVADTDFRIRNSISCPHCGTAQDTGENCRHCGHPLHSTVAYQYTAKPASSPLESEPLTTEPPLVSSHSWNLKLPMFFLFIIAVGAYISFHDQLPVWLGGPAEEKQVAETTESKPDSASTVILKGIFSEKGQSSAQPQAPYQYDPESGENPYRKRLESIGVDPDELAKSQGIKGSIRPDQLNEVLDNSAIGNTVHNVAGDTATSNTND